MDHNLRLADWCGQRVRVVIDRPLGTSHPDDDSIVYDLNYGFVPGTMAPDGEPLDVYIIDADAPLSDCQAEVIAIIRRHDDVEDKLVARIADRHWTAGEIEDRTAFQEKWFDTSIEVGDVPESFEHGYTNHTVREGMTVLKVYVGPDASLRHSREVSALRALGGQVPVPEIIEAGPDRIRTRWIAGRHGKDLMTADHDVEMLAACGATLRRIHAVDPSTLFPDPPTGSTLVHGDYGPNNVLLSEAATEVVAVLDWEWAHPGDPVEDLAWCEWIVRTFHPNSIGALHAFYATYGDQPTWSSRHSAMLTKLRQLHQFAERREPDGPVAETRLRQLEMVKSWTDLNRTR